jgi:hypothetical protein
MMMASISPSPESSVRNDLPSPRVGVDFCLRRRLKIFWEKYGLGFWAKRRLWYKGGPDAMVEERTGLGGVANMLGRATWVRSVHVAPVACFFRSQSFSK